MQKIYCYEESPLTEAEIPQEPFSFKTENELKNYLKKSHQIPEELNGYIAQDFTPSDELRETIFKILNDNFLTAKDYIASKEYEFVNYKCSHCLFDKLQKEVLYVAEHYEKSVLICVCIACGSEYLIYDEAKPTKA